MNTTLETTTEIHFPTLDERFASMMDRIADRTAIELYVEMLKETGFSKSEILKMESDFDYITDDEINNLMDFKVRDFGYLVI